MKIKFRFGWYVLGLVVGINSVYAEFGFANPNRSVWDELRQQFILDHALTQPAVQTQLRWLVNHPNYLQKLTQSEPYIYHIVTEIKKRHMPGEIALIPMVESAYDPFAYSGAGAAGLWQLMPGTGTDLGLKQDWWYDARRSIPSSTNAALNYLLYLHNIFNNDWALAFAAYDLGGNALARVIKSSHQDAQRINFWTLSVPAETRAYVPRLLALAEIIQNPERYHIQLPDIPPIPYFEEVDIGTPIDLNNAAKLAGMTYHDFIKLNPGYNRWATAPYRPYKVLIPVNKVERFNRNLALLPENKRVSWARHQVTAGDNLTIIAKRYHTTVNLIKELNQLKSNAVQQGQYVLIPQTSTKTANNIAHTATHFKQPKSYKIIHIVDQGDSYQGLQQQFHVSAAQIQQWNSLTPMTPLRVGQSLVIWKSTQTALYKITSGDSLGQIAAHHYTTVQQLQRLNPGVDPSRLQLGQVLQVG